MCVLNLLYITQNNSIVTKTKTLIDFFSIVLFRVLSKCHSFITNWEVLLQKIKCPIFNCVWSNKGVQLHVQTIKILKKNCFKTQGFYFQQNLILTTQNRNSFCCLYAKTNKSQIFCLCLCLRLYLCFAHFTNKIPFPYAQQFQRDTQ